MVLSSARARFAELSCDIATDRKESCPYDGNQRHRDEVNGPEKKHESRFVAIGCRPQECAGEVPGVNNASDLKSSLR